MPNLTKDQAKAVEYIAHWDASSIPGNVFFLSGAAGTGKTWLVSYLIEKFNWDPLVIAPTNKAVQVLNQKGVKAITIHSAIYYPPEVLYDEEGEPELFFEYEGLKCYPSIIIVDEVSMVGSQVGADLERSLLSLGIPLLAVGDIHQLPPVKDTRWIKDPDIEMIQVMRHESSILNFATMIRESDKIADLELCEHKDLAIKRSISKQDILDADIILCRTHIRRCALNQQKRKLLGYPNGRPVPGERLFVLVNDYKRGLFNGEEVIYQPPYLIAGPHKKVVIPKEYVLENLNDPRSWQHANLAYGYATTVHKAQGSEWDIVVLTDIENRHPAETPQEYKQWLYTGATRAKKRLILA